MHRLFAAGLAPRALAFGLALAATTCAAAAGVPAPPAPILPAPGLLRPAASPTPSPSPSPTPAGAIRDISLLSPNDRASLPDSTLVGVLGKSLTLGALRQNHAALLASFGQAAALGAASLKYRSPISHVIPQPGHALPGPAVVSATPVPLIAPPAGTPGYPRDYAAFCGAVQATVCLYYPANVAYYSVASNAVVIIDPLIVDPQVCSADGGSSAATGCNFYYPILELVNFIPPAAGFSTPSGGQCNLNGIIPMLGTVDPNGAVQVKYYYGRDSTGSTPSYCWYQVNFSPA